MGYRLALTLITALVAALALAATAAAQPRFTPAGKADIRPGSMTFTNGAQCTANFVFFDRSNLYIGQAAHCASRSSSSQTNGCRARSYPVGTRVRIEGARRRGTMVYSSWVTMRRTGERRDALCFNNDFALIRIARADEREVNPTIPFWGGPTGLVGRTRRGQDVYSYGNSSLRFGIDALKPKRGKSLGQCCGGWSHDVYTFTPGIPGDSGSAFVQSAGKAFGVLSTVALAPFPASNGVSDLSRMLRYMEARTSIDVTLARGTKRFRG